MFICEHICNGTDLESNTINCDGVKMFKVEHCNIIKCDYVKVFTLSDGNM